MKRGPLTPLVAGLAVLAATLAGCSSDRTAASRDGASQNSASPDSASRRDAVAVPADLAVNHLGLDMASSSEAVVNLRQILVSGELPTLVWFWAPY